MTTQAPLILRLKLWARRLLGRREIRTTGGAGHAPPVQHLQESESEVVRNPASDTLLANIELLKCYEFPALQISALDMAVALSEMEKYAGVIGQLVPYLVILLVDVRSEQQVRRRAGNILVGWSSNHTLVNDMRQVIPPIFNLVQMIDTPVEIRRDAVGVLAQLLEDAVFTDFGQRLLSMATPLLEGDPTDKCCAMEWLTNLLKNPAFTNVVGEHTSAFVRFLEDSDNDVRYHAAVILAELSMNTSFTNEIVLPRVKLVVNGQNETITLHLFLTSDNQRVIARKDVVERSAVIRSMLETLGELEEVIPLPNVTSIVFKKVLEYCEHHRDEPLPTLDDDGSDGYQRRGRTSVITGWDKTFIEQEQDMLFDILIAANYLDIQPLLDLGCKTVADMIKGKTPEEIRRLFNIVNDFTPEEEAQIKKENEWAEDR